MFLSSLVSMQFLPSVWVGGGGEEGGGAGSFSFRFIFPDGDSFVRSPKGPRL
jgi:hypothetical protein